MKQIEQINKNTWRIPLSLPNQSDVFAYVIKGRFATLIDCGHPSSKSQADLRSGLAAVGLALSDIKKVILTHRHIDHLGALVSVEGGLEHAEIVAHEGPTQPIVNLDSIDQVIRYVPDNSIQLVMDEAAIQHLKVYYAFHQPLRIDSIVRHGDTISIGDDELEVMHTPGHSPDHISLLHKKTATLFGGDLLLQNGPPAINDLDAYIRSMEFLHEVVPLQCVLPGHGLVIEDHKRVIANIRDRIEMTDQKIVEAILQGAVTPYEIALYFTGGKIHRGIKFFLEVILVHLEQLSKRNKVELFMNNYKIEKVTSRPTEGGIHR